MLETAGAADQAEQPELKRETGIHRLLCRRRPGLVVYDREPFVREPIDPVDPAMNDDARERRLASGLGS